MNGAANLWLLLHPDAPRDPLAKALRTFLAVTAKSYGFERLQIAIAERYTGYRAFLETLGFVYERPAPGYGPKGEDYLMMVLANQGND